MTSNQSSASSHDRHHRSQHQAQSEPNHPAVVASIPRQILTSLAPQLMSNRLFNSNAFASTFSNSPSFINQTRPHPFSSSNPNLNIPTLDISKVIKLLLPASLGGRGGIQLNDLLITDPIQIDNLLALDLPPASTSNISNPNLPKHHSSDLSLLDGFQASLPSSIHSKNNRRIIRATIGHKLLGLDEPGQDRPISLHLKYKLDSERSLLSDSDPQNSNSHRRKSSAGNVDHPTQKIKKRTRRRKTDIIGLSKSQPSSLPLQDSDLNMIKEIIPELKTELRQIVKDRENLQIRKELISKDLNEVDLKIKQLHVLKQDLERSMLSLKEEELELIDEYEGINDRLTELQEALPMIHTNLPQPPSTSRSSTRLSSTNFRRRRGPAFLPAEHDELPKNVSFMTLRGHSQAIVDLDFSGPYGFLVSSSCDESVQVWDLATGEPIERLHAHSGMVKCLQVEDLTCITGGVDGRICVWDLDRAIDIDCKLESSSSLKDKGLTNDLSKLSLADNRPGDQLSSNQNPCVMKLEGHSRSVTALYYDEACLVTGSSDKTIRQWDLNTGQAVMTMDILWAMQNPPLLSSTSPSRRQLRTPSSTISDFQFGPKSSMTSASSWRAPSGRTGSVGNEGDTVDLIDEPLTQERVHYYDSRDTEYIDYIGGIQFWGYALASGSGDGCVRMWDMRTGQAHRTLVGHTAPITCLQFDETHLVSGSIDKSIRIWDLRTGAVSETIMYSQPITSLQFDSRKIMCTAGGEGINVYNRTTLQRSTINLNGHTDAVECLRYFDGYMVSGSKDTTIKVWSI